MALILEQIFTNPTTALLNSANTFQGPEWEFQTKLPDWAEENWVPPN